MGIVNTEITLKNLNDDVIAKNGYIKPEEVRTATITAVADTGSLHLVITEDIQKKLGLGFKDEKTANIANGQSVKCYLTDAVEIQWKNRRTVLPAVVIPGSEKVLFGAIPMEAMDLMVNPVNQEVVGVHGDKEEYLAVSVLAVM